MNSSKVFRAHHLLIFILLFNAFSVHELCAQEKSAPDTIFITRDTVYQDLDEVVISATRVAKKIIDIPYSVVRVDNLSFRYDRRIGMNDMLSNVPGLFLQSRYGNHDVRISIRGFGSRSNSGVRGVRILLDDLPESEPDGQTRLEAIDFNSVGTIEIVKGNASSLYTNAPGGVVNFINDIDFKKSSVVSLNQFGSFGLRRNGFKAAVKTDHYRLLTTYSYQNYEGYRPHSGEYWNILNIVLEANPSEHSSLKVLGYYVNGEIKLPGSLKKEEWDKDPFMASQRSIDRDEKRISDKGRIGIRYNAEFGKSLNNEFEITTYGTIKYFERTAKDYRIINRYGLGITGRYINKSEIGKSTNEFSVGGDIFSQPARTEYYENINGTKGDQILQLVEEDIVNRGFYLSDNFELLHEKMFLLLTARYDNVVFRQNEETLPSREDERTFNGFTPKLALNYKLSPLIALYTSYGLSFDSPANNELDSPDPEYLFNQDLEPQESRNFEVGAKGAVHRWEAKFFRSLTWDGTLFNINLDNEIIPYEVIGDVFYRNAAQTHRIGMELGAWLEVMKGLDFTVSYTYSYFTYKSYQAKSIEVDSTGNYIESDEDYTGHYVPSVPESNLYLAVAYSRNIYRQIDGFVKMSYNGVSGLWVDDANSDKTDAYNLANAVLGFDMQFGKFNILISGGIENLFDEIYVGFTNTNSADKRFYEAGAPRNFFATINLGYSF